MADIASSPLTRVWGRLMTLAPFVQSYPEFRPRPGGANIVKTRTWDIGGVEVPVISGDSIRGRLRRALADDLLDRLACEPRSLPVRTAHLLFVGGSLNADKSSLTPTGLDEQRHLLPVLALLGGTTLGTFAPGRLRAGHWVAQTNKTPTPALHNQTDPTALPDPEATLMTEQFARSGADLRDIYDPQVINAAFAKAGDDSPQPPALNMPHSYRAVVPGIDFAGWIAIAAYRGLTPDDDTVQRACLRYGLDLAYPDGVDITLGLRAASGYGLVRIDWEDLDQIGPSADPYLDHINRHRNDLVELLTSDRLVPERKT
jgi:hypothetical protein